MTGRILDTIARLRLLRAELAPDKRDRITIRVYDRDYSALVILSDEIGVFQPYLEGEDANHSATFLYRKARSGIYGRLDKHFEIIKKHSKDVTTPYIFMMRGHTCSGKTILAGRLAKTYHIPIVATYSIRQTLFPELLDPSDYVVANLRYRETASRIYERFIYETSLSIEKAKLGLVLDGSFPFKRWREPIYNLCSKYGAHLVIISCTCNDESEIRKRLVIRQGNTSLLPTERARDEEVYLSSLRDIEPISDEEIDSISRLNVQKTMVKYNSYTNNFEYSHPISPELKRIFDDAKI